MNHLYLKQSRIFHCAQDALGPKRPQVFLNVKLNSSYLYVEYEVMNSGQVGSRLINVRKIHN